MIIRKARREDVYQIVRLLADDELGKQREDFRDPLPESYEQAFDSINEDKNQELIVVQSPKGEVVGTLQLSFIPYLTYRGAYAHK